jgi:nucleoside-diphosphate-sugar epimerase
MEGKILSGVLEDDMERIASDDAIPWEKTRNRTILVTGATGTIGSALVRGLYAADRKRGLGLRILALGRDESKAQPLARQYGAEFIRHDIREPLAIEGSVDSIFHGAAAAKSLEMAANPVGVIETSVKGTFNVLALAREKRVQSMVFLSSMEVYGITDPALPRVTEDILGYLDLKAARSCYPESKRLCENLCNCHHAQYGVPVKTARLAQTFGAGSDRRDTLVFAQFARGAMAGENIVLHTEGETRRDYCYISDAVRGLILLLLAGKDGEAYNIANTAANATIREMAELIANEICGGRVSVIVDKPKDIEKRGYAPDVTRRMSSAKIERLGWKPEYGLADMYRRMIAGWREGAESGI